MSFERVIGQLLGFYSLSLKLTYPVHLDLSPDLINPVHHPVHLGMIIPTTRVEIALVPSTSCLTQSPASLGRLNSTNATE